MYTPQYKHVYVNIHTYIKMVIIGGVLNAWSCYVNICMYIYSRIYIDLLF